MKIVFLLCIYLGIPVLSQAVSLSDSKHKTNLQILKANAGLDQNLLDRENDGFEYVVFDGRGSHARNKKEKLNYQWSIDSKILSTNEVMTAKLSQGKHKVKLEILGDNSKAADNVDIIISPVKDKLQRLNLSSTASSDRFRRPLNKKWPIKNGTTDICLWEDDKFAAVSITIDDNIAVDHNWWVKLGKKYNWNFTWFIIINSLDESRKDSYFGSWSKFQLLADLGHDIQSHSMTHHADDDTRADTQIIKEYQDSLNEINHNITENNAITVAWPSGRYNRDVGALFAVAGRGTVATPNKPERIDYLNVNSTSTGVNKDYLDSIIDGSSAISWLGNKQYLRGWFVSHYHFVKDKKTVESEFKSLNKRSSDLWLGLFKDVARYGQERDTAKLTSVTNNIKKVEFYLSDEMDDGLFDYPLTIKIKLYPHWQGITATQAKNKLETTIVTHNKNKYALIKVIPDQGVIVIKPINK